MKRTNNYHIESRDNEKTDDFTPHRRGHGAGRGKGKKKKKPESKGEIKAWKA